MKLFWKIFLSFWLATVLMIALVVAANEMFPLAFRNNTIAPFDPKAAQMTAEAVANTYEVFRARHDTVAEADVEKTFARLGHRKPFFLFNAKGQMVLGKGEPPPFYTRVAREALSKGHSELRRYRGMRLLFVSPVRSMTGHRYAAVMTVLAPGLRLGSRLERQRFWLNLAIGMLSTAFVCMILSLYLTRPIRKLRKTAQQLASGDLSARASFDQSRRRDELGDLARDFDAMATQIQALLTSQRRFVTDISHELGAPLTRLHLALALMRRRLAGEHTTELERIEKEAGKLSDLVQQLLILASMEVGRCPVETLAPTSLQTLCKEIIGDASLETAKARCRINSSLQDAIFLAYPQLLRRAIDNVLRNAIRYSPLEGSIRFEARVDLDRLCVRIQIEDSGPGIPDPMLSDVFRPFFRAEQGRASDTGGTGLGLAIAYEAVQLHHGTIYARNRKPKGLAVTILLPLQMSEVAEMIQDGLAPDQSSLPLPGGLKSAH